MRFLKRLLHDVIGEEASRIIGAMDIIGDIAIIKVPPELEGRKALIGETILKHLKHVKAVYRQLGGVTGEYRLRPLEHIAGEERTLTQHREYGCVYLVDVKSVFFTPRLGGERARIASLVRDGELVLNMFAGVGPFSILIAKRKPRSTVYSIEANPAAYDLLVKNIELNKVRGRVIPLLGDARLLVPALELAFDRVLMPYPEGSLGFIGVALEAVKRGGFIHYYRFGRGIEQILEELKDLSSLSLRGWRRVREIAPYMAEYVLDFVKA